MCVLELNANGVEFSTLRQAYHYVEAQVDFNQIPLEEVPVSFYKSDWTLDRSITQGYGDIWFRNKRSLVLKVNSAVLPADSNYIVNTLHHDFQNIGFSAAKPVDLDQRI